MTKQSFVSYALVCALILFATSCKKTEGTSSNPTIPSITTLEGVVAGGNSIQSGGTISSDGGSPVIARGVTWERGGEVADSTNITTDGAGIGTFTSTIPRVSPNSTYYIKAYAKNAIGTAYGNSVMVITEPGIPTMRTDSINHQTSYKWIGNGRIENNGGVPLSAKGFCWSTHPHPTLADSHMEVGGGVTRFEGLLTLPANSTIYYCAYGTNSYGTGYGNEIIYTTGIAVGLYYQGGVICTVDASGQHGLIAALVNQSNSAPWYFTYNYNTLARSPTDGLFNTLQIITLFGAGSYAANLCRNYSGGGYTDWYLPASQQIFYMDLSGVVPDFPGYVPPSGTVFYWSSTEFSAGEAISRVFYATTHLSIQEQKNHLGKVRAVREF